MVSMLGELGSLCHTELVFTKRGAGISYRELGDLSLTATKLQGGKQINQGQKEVVLHASSGGA